MNPGRGRGGRRAKYGHDLARRRPKRTSKDRVLIACEGGKTEPNYLKEIVQDLGLTSADVEICGKECDSAPKSVVEFALKRFQEDGHFDRVICVFDKDSHTTYDAAVNLVKTRRMRKGKTLEAVKSVPCFEYWVLLHFGLTTKPYARSGKRSPCDNVIRDLKKKEGFRDYEKGSHGLYDRLKDRIDDAIENARNALEQATRADTDNPTTEMHLLVEYLRALKDQ
jgi:hypothetical protein